MKTCICGGMLYSHGRAQGKTRQEGKRYRCKVCGKCITVRAGQIVTNTGPRVADWRTETEGRI